MRPLLILTGACAAGALIFASAGLADQPVAQTLNPSPPSYYTCKAVGNGTICDGTRRSSRSGRSTPLTKEPHRLRQRRERLRHLRRGHRSGHGETRLRRRRQPRPPRASRRLQLRAVQQSADRRDRAVQPDDKRTDVFAVPGDLGSATETTNWKIPSTCRRRRPVFINTGRTVQAPDGATESCAGRLDFWKLFVDGRHVGARPALRRARGFVERTVGAGCRRDSRPGDLRVRGMPSRRGPLSDRLAAPRILARRTERTSAIQSPSG